MSALSVEVLQAKQSDKKNIFSNQKNTEAFY